MEFETTIAGIPCRVEVVQYRPGRAMRITGTGFGDAEPPGDEAFCFEVLDRDGRKAPWLERKLTATDASRIKREYLELKREEDAP